MSYRPHKKTLKRTVSAIIIIFFISNEYRESTKGRKNRKGKKDKRNMKKKKTPTKTQPQAPQQKPKNPL